jgi:hypothetical protein
MQAPNITRSQSSHPIPPFVASSRVAKASSFPRSYRTSRTPEFRSAQPIAHRETHKPTQQRSQRPPENPVTTRFIPFLQENSQFQNQLPYAMSPLTEENSRSFLT